MSMIPVYEPDLSGMEKEYLIDALDSTWISSKGPYLDQFEYGLQSYLNIQNVTTVSNGTVALHLALLAIGIEPGDEVIVPSFTYIAAVNAIKYVGATPVFVDVDEYWHIDLNEVLRKISPKTKAVIAVHMYGYAANLIELSHICSRNNIYLVEDCAEALGTFFAGKHVGCYGHIATFSFFGNKTITTGEGGAVASIYPDLINKVKHFKNQGLSSYKEYWHDVLGYNYRLTNLQAAIGCAQLERVQLFLDKKLELASFYRKELEDYPIIFQQGYSQVRSSHWMISILFDSQQVRDAVRVYLKTFGVETRPLFPLVSGMPMYHDPAKYPVSTDISSRGINLPSSPVNWADKAKIVTSHIKSYFSKKL